MMGIDCADIVVAETLEKAMKLFDFQWHVFDNTRPTKMSFKNINDLKQSLRLLRITDIDIEKLDATNANDLIELADEIGNPSTIPQLKNRCRNPLFRYILGRDAKTGRNPIVIRW